MNLALVSIRRRIPYIPNTATVTPQFDCAFAIARSEHTTRESCQRSDAQFVALQYMLTRLQSILCVSS